MSNTVALGQILYTKYVYLFEAAGLILLVAMIGAIVLTLQHKRDVKRQSVARQVARTRETGVEVVEVETGRGLVVTIGLSHYLTVAAILFTLGIFGIFLNRKNVIVILMSIELMLLAVNLNLVAFSAFHRRPRRPGFRHHRAHCRRSRSRHRPRHRRRLLPQPRHHRCRRNRSVEGLALKPMYQAIVFLPLIGAIFAGFFGWLVPARASEVITTSLVLITALLSWFAFYQVGIEGHETRIELLRFIDSGALQTSWALRIDTLTAVMLVVVTTVSGLVHLYSIGYMEEDPHRPRFFAYLSLFTFAMLALVTADNFLQLFFGWEGVGLMSYLLIGFWYHRPSANAAAIKAFIVNRVGDFGFALGIFAVFTVFNSLQYDTVFASAPDQVGKTMEFLGMQVDVLTTICLLLFIGAMGKSAQFLLHTWLPDAMEGPTPVSALIHAATMVTAGVFMVARLSPLFELAPIALAVVTVFGATTAFFAATVGLVQNDIKRVVAYSTCSQLGYMFVAEGVGAYGTGIFHLFTHAFFKALLFLGAGAVIHRAAP